MLARNTKPIVLALIGAVGAVACAEPVEPPPVRTINGPTAIAFSCFGPIAEAPDCPAGSDPATCVAPTSAMPAAACRAWDQAITVDETDGVASCTPPSGLGPSECGESGDAEICASKCDSEWQGQTRLYGFVLQPKSGTMAMLSMDLGNVIYPFGIEDPDPYAPGRNVIPVGTLPVGLATDAADCHLMTANAGSCDLSLMSVNSVVAADQRAEVRRVPVVNAAGNAIAAKPRAIAAEPAQATSFGAACGPEPTGKLYIAYPDCNMVAVVDPSSGEVQAGIVFRQDGTVEITDGNVGCEAAVCGGIVPEAPDAGGAPRPVAVTVQAGDAGDDDEGNLIPVRRLYIGADNSPNITVVELDEAFMPDTAVPETAVWQIPLEGDIGISGLAVTDFIDKNSASDFRFVYAVASDGTVRVADVHELRRECDTQIDTRFVHDNRNASELFCLQSGAYPRRVGAISPGIHMPGAARPLSVAFARQDTSKRRVGYFAFITTTTGGTLLVNVDDEAYANFEDAEDPLLVDMALAMPHQIRDGVKDFGDDRASSRYCPDPGEDNDISQRVCAFQEPISACVDPGTSVGPRTTGVINVVIDEDIIDSENSDQLPYLREVAVSCTVGEDDETDTGDIVDIAVPELSFLAPDYRREVAFPDLRSVRTEQWLFAWEGRLSLDSFDDAIDGPPVRFGSLARGDSLELGEGGAPYCDMGVEPYDTVTLLGCSPARGNRDCEFGYTCYLPPDAPDEVETGLCLPENRLAELGDACRGLLNSERRFSVLETHAERLVLGERRRVLRTTPVDGCVDTAQCEGLYQAEWALAQDPDDDNPPEAPARTWACEPDPSRASDRNYCVMQCSADTDCEGGWVCSSGYCVAGVVPPAECLATVQPYEVRVGEAFSVIGRVTGFLHQRIADPDTGVCIDDPNGNPLATGRVPLAVPPCASGDLPDPQNLSGPVDFTSIAEVLPNPCRVTVTHPVVQDCDPDAVAGCDPETSTIPVPVDVEAIRFRNSVFTTHLVNLTVADPDLGPYPIVFRGFALSLSVTGGFAPIQLATQVIFGDVTSPVKFPISITAGPLQYLWVLDQGDTSTTRRGRVIRFLPDIDTFLVSGLDYLE